MTDHTITETLMIGIFIAVISRLAVAILEWIFLKFYIKGNKELLVIWHRFRNPHHVNAGWCRRRGCFPEIKRY